MEDRKIEDISNPRLVKLKEKTLRWHFDIIHVPGKIHLGPDTLSRKEVSVCLINMLADQNLGEWWFTEELEGHIEATVASNFLLPISWNYLKDAVSHI